MSDLPQQQTINQYIADGIEAIYFYTYLIPENQDINVYVTPSGQQANDNADIKILNVDYTVQNAGDINGGTITFINIPNSGDTVTLSRAVEASIDTNYVAAQTINGINLDNSFQREMLVIQQNQTKFDDRSLRYQVSSLVPDTTNRNIVPTLDPGYIWIGASAGGVAAAFLEENPDCSTLRSELASETQGSDGAGLVGFYDEQSNTSTTVRDNLNLVNSFLFNQVEFAQTGDIKFSWSPNPPAGGWITASGTIGSPLSGADYADDNAQNLYEFFWNTFPDAICPVIGGRGPDAQFDFLADKPLTQPPTDGRTFVAPNPYTPGETFGADSVQLTVNELPAHGHLPASGYGYVSLSIASGGPLEGGVNRYKVEPFVSQDTGGDQPHENRQPSICINVYVKL